MKNETMKFDVSVLYDFSAMLEEEKARAKAAPVLARETVEEKTSRWRMWLRKMGVAGFVFFTVKGLLWLAVPAVAARLMA